MADRQRLPELRYRIVCYELEDDTETVILDATAQGFIAITGTIADDGTMGGEGAHAGPLRLQRRLARLIADDKHLAGENPGTDRCARTAIAAPSGNRPTVS